LPDLRILIADDEKVLRDALTDVIEDTDGLTVVAVVENAEDAISATHRVKPDVALLDVRMPGGGPRAARGIRDCCPEVRVLALSASGSQDTVLEMLQAGAVGYLVKGILPSEVIAGIFHAAAGEAPISPEVAGGVIDRLRGQLEIEAATDKRRSDLLEQLTIALDGGGLDMVYQPIVDLDTQELVGVESLAKFSMTPARPPNEWFDSAAELGLQTRLELAAVARALSRRSDLPNGMFMSVNLSPATLMSPDVAALIPDAFAGRLLIEVTEHTPVADYIALRDAMAPLRAAGVTLAIDDAGAGFASLRHILKLSPHYIKLDISLTQNIEHDAGTIALAVALTSFAGSIGAQVIAEGIETQSQLDALRALGIHLGQGYHLGRPMFLAQVTQMVDARAATARLAS
jgi:EAL domain-containing protein (putative c-di-GMP-specific phosphodiesterase class I)/ActR/RegA family two-component response regulator